MAKKKRLTSDRWIKGKVIAGARIKEFPADKNRTYGKYTNLIRIDFEDGSYLEFEAAEHRTGLIVEPRYSPSTG